MCSGDGKTCRVVKGDFSHSRGTGERGARACVLGVSYFPGPQASDRVPSLRFVWKGSWVIERVTWDSVSQLLRGRERRLIHSDAGVLSVRQAACVRIRAAPRLLRGLREAGGLRPVS